VSSPVASTHTGAGPVKTEHRVGPVADIPLGEGRAYAVAGEQVAVFRLRDGSLRAVSAVCPHRGGPIADGQIDDRIVLCPLHLNAFDLTSGACTTAAYALQTYPVRVDGSDVVVTVP
jgi:nitrite reductase/ring-hydroxylating ferredoxin subunit